MPGFDKSGPMGTGSMTGRGRGYCNTADSENASTYTQRYARGRGCGRGRFTAGGLGRGLGRGFGWGSGGAGVGFSAPMGGVSSPPNELEYLTQEAQNLEKNLQMIKKRIDDLQQKSE